MQLEEFAVVDPAWLWYSFPEVQNRKETESGLQHSQPSGHKTSMQYIELDYTTKNFRFNHMSGDLHITVLFLSEN